MKDRDIAEIGGRAQRANGLVVATAMAVAVGFLVTIMPVLEP
jgi:hypothetical protein